MRCKYLFVIVLIGLVTLQTECRRSSSGGRRTGSSSSGSRSSGGRHSTGGFGSHSSSTGYHGSTNRHGGGTSFGGSLGGNSHGTTFGGGGFGGVPYGSGASSQGTRLGGSSISNTHTVTGGIGFQPHSSGGGVGDTFKQTNVHHVNANNPTSSNSKAGIGFENVNRQTASAPLQNNRHDIGFENVHNRLPPQSTHNAVTPRSHQTLGNAVTSRASGVLNNRPTSSHFQRPITSSPYVPHQATFQGSNFYRPYQPQTVVLPGGGVQYHPPLQARYTPPPTTTYIPVYQPVPLYQSYPVYQQSSGGSALGYGGSFLGGYLIGRMSGSGYRGHDDHHIYHHHTYSGGSNSNNDYSSTGSGGATQQNNYYTVHHYHQNRQEVPTKFSVPDDNMVQCPTNTSQMLCAPNTDAICLKNGTIMCVTSIPFTIPCSPGSNMSCVYTRVECAGDPGCNPAPNQTYAEFYLPCISNVTLSNNRVVETSVVLTNSTYELCVTAIAHPKKTELFTNSTVVRHNTLESPVGPLVLLVGEVGKWHLNNLADIHNSEKRP